MLRRFRFVAILMIIAILTCRIGIVNVNAAEGVTSQNTAKELSGLRITDLDKPVAGRILDQKARVRTNENVTWEIPVIWVDDLGNTAYEAVPGRTYYPSFAFYVPEGYTISTKATGAGLGIKLPDFLSAVFGNTPYIFVGDAATGITYITYIPSYIESKASNADTSSASIDRAASIWPGHDGTQNTTHEDPYGENHADDDNDKPAGGHAAPSPQPQPVADPYEQVRIHCSADVIDRIGLEALNELVTLIKNKLEPQAVNLLKNSFEGYRNATSELGKQIGLYIYYENGAVIDSAGDSNPSPAGALAYVSAGYTDIPEGGTVFELFPFISV